MNKIYKKIFNKSRGCFVAVSEALTSASQSSGKAAATVVIGSTLMITPSAFAEINTSQWATEVDHTAEINHVIDFQGGTYAQIVGFTSWADKSRMALVNITSTGGLTGGVYGHNDFIGDAGTLGSSGKLRHWAIDNSGSIVDSTTVPTRDDGITTQLGTTNWINKYANRAGASLNVFDLRSSEILNESNNFTTVGLHLEEGGQLENKGAMNVGSLRVGVVDDGLFSKNQVRTADDTVVLPNVTYSTGETTTVLNEGTINAETAHIAGVLTNKNAFNTTDANGEKSVFGTTHNEGTISLAADADFTVLNQTTTASEVSGKNITVTKELNNTKGSITASEKLAVEGILTNAASIEAKSLEIKATGAESAQNTNTGTINATDGVSVFGKFSNTGTIEAGKGLTVSGTTAKLGGTINGDALTLADATATINSDQVKLKKLESTGTSTLSNSHNLEFDSINAGAGLTYNQTAGSISAKDGSFFNGSTLNISGGKLERVASITENLGTGNTVNISGANALTVTDQGKLEANWADDQTVVKVGTLDSNSTVNVASGGVLESGKLALTSQTLTLNGGTLINSLSDLFEVAGEEAFTIDEGLKTELDSSVLGAKDVKGLKADVTNNILFGENGGNFVISDEYHCCPK